MNLPSKQPGEESLPLPVESLPPTPLATPDTQTHDPQPLTKSRSDTVESAEDAAALHGVRPGTLIDGYEVLESIGRGGMGIVLKVRQPSTGQTVALKMIRAGQAADADSVARFQREVHALGRVQPVKNIVPIYHVGQHQGEFFFVMPFLAGGNLSRRLKEFVRDPRLAAATAEKIARATHQLHCCQLLHRDIKPGNILLDADGEPFLSDFGLIKLLDEDDALTHTQQRLGTPAYMAPEQTGLVPGGACPQTDIWALGVMLYEMLTGTRPFASKQPDNSTLLWKIVNEAPAAPRTLNPDLDPGLEAVILKCLEKDPADRFRSAAELADELGRWLRHEKLQTQPASPVQRRIRRHRIAVGLIVAALFVLVALSIAYPFWRQETPEQRLESLRRELADRGEVVLLGDKGQAGWLAKALDGPVTSFIDGDGLWNLDTWDIAMIDLLRDIPIERPRPRPRRRGRSRRRPSRRRR
jgi:serine/threonine-protein kinase